MKSVVDKHSKVLAIPHPITLFDGFGDSSLKFRVLFWVQFDEGLLVNSEVALQIFDSLKDSGIEVPISQRIIYVEPGSDANSGTKI